MTNWTGSESARRINCSRCGMEFSCNPAGACWCKEETVRLPMPIAGEDCLCPQCLHKAAEAHSAPSVG